jgi:GGDEF domain-containing protein
LQCGQRVLVSLLLGLFTPINAGAQHFIFRHYGQDEGLRNLDVKSIRVTSSFGVVWMDLPNMGVEDMVRCADEALYKAKATGRDRIIYYTPHHRRHLHLVSC